MNEATNKQSTTQDQHAEPSLVGEIIHLLDMGKATLGKDEPVENYLTAVLQHENIRGMLMGAMLACHTMRKLQSIGGSDTDVQ